jgi:uncharacterized protein (DUF1684 family)
MPRPLTPEYLESLSRWRRRKEQDLLRRDSWVALAGLHWLREGRQTAGSGESADLRLPASAPARIGEFELNDGRVVFHKDDSVWIEDLPAAGALQPDTSDSPTYLRLGDTTLVVIERGGRFGLRVWDNARLAAPSFRGRAWYEAEAAFVIDAGFDSAGAGATIPVPSVTGDVTETPLLGTARFYLGGQPSKLVAIATDDGLPWFLFADPSNEATTYPGGRFLVADTPHAGAVTLDFNRAYNPPCAFTPYATCPLPPEGNRLAHPIEAGERYDHEE